MYYLASIRGAEIPVIICGMVFSFAYLISRGSAREKMERRRIELVEKALESGVIDAQTKRDLLAVVAGSKGSKIGPLFLIGWVGLFVGIALLGVHWLVPGADNELAIAGILVGLISFAVLTLPIAARELNARSQPQRNER